MFGAAPSVADKRLVETLCTVRALQRGTARRLRILLKIFTLGILGADPERDSYTPEHLKQAALFGHYNKVVDILDHWSEVSPNDRCEEGDTPFIAAVIRALEVRYCYQFYHSVNDITSNLTSHIHFFRERP